jgi:hypothetical protein
LSLAIQRLEAGSSDHFAMYVLQAPYRAGYVLADRVWSPSLNQVWQAWQEFFATRAVPLVPHISEANALNSEAVVPPVLELGTGQPMAKSVRLMQTLGIHLWQWLFHGELQTALSQSQGIAMGQNHELRLRLDIRDPDLLAMPWEIMQHQPGRPSISISPQILFSRTTSDVDTLPPLRADQSLNILLVLGQDQRVASPANSADTTALKLNHEAEALVQLLTRSTRFGGMAACRVDTLVQPTPEQLIQQLDQYPYNVLFYAGHGMPAPDGGVLFLRPDRTINGTELAQILIRARVKLAVFNACWGAQSDQEGDRIIPRSSLANVLLHQGVPAVLGMRDAITDQEALCFIQAFAQALAERLPIDRAVAVARQQLLAIFKFNQQAWTLPVLYMHPDFDGELIQPRPVNLTQIPHQPPALGQRLTIAALRSPISDRMWPLRGGLMRIGISDDNDLVLLGEAGVSRKHAEILGRTSSPTGEWSYVLRDFSRYGTWVLSQGEWQKVHHEDVLLQPGACLRFGDPQNAVLEFVVIESESV